MTNILIGFGLCLVIELIFFVASILIFIYMESKEE